MPEPDEVARPIGDHLKWRFQQVLHRLWRHGKPSISSLMVLIMTSLVLLPLLAAGLYFYNVLSASLQHQAENYLESFITTINQNLENRFASIDNTSMIMLSSREMRQLLTNEDLPASQRASEMSDLLKYQLFFNRAWDNKLIEKVFVCKNILVYFSTPENIFNPAAAAEVISSLYGKTDDLAVDKYLIPPTPGNPSIYYFRNINDINTTRNIGRLFLQINPAKLNENSSHLRYDSAMLLTFNDSGTIFSHTDPERIGQAVDTGLFKMRNSAGLTEIELDGQVFLATSNHLPAYGMYSIVAVPRAEVFAELYRTTRIFLQYLAMLLLSCLILAFLISRRLVRPINSVMSSINSFKNGHFSQRMSSQNSREFDELAQVFNNMAGEIDHLIHEVYEKQLLLHESELQNLQAQVNPHFLFNILETIGWQATISNNSVIQTMVTSLGQLLRAGLSWSGSETITVADELQYIRFYLDLQKIRFADRLDIGITIADNTLLDLHIPKLSIMPLVENAFIHGLEPKKGPGTLQIRVWEESEALYFQIIDNGVGFDTRTVQLEPAGPVLRRSGNACIGIVNSHRRIQLLYGRSYGIKLKSSPGEGTSVTVVLPKVKPATNAGPDSGDLAQEA